MALSAVKTWIAGEVLTAADLNSLNTNILNNALSLISPLTGNLDVDNQNLLDIGEVEFRDAAANPTATRRFRLNGSTLWWLVEDARTNTVIRPLGIRATTTGAPAASIGVGLSFDAESADEAPSNFGALDFVATDVGAATEDTVFDILLRTAGAAAGARYRFASTGAFLLTFTGAPTAARTITIPDSSFTIPTAQEFDFITNSDTEVTTTSTTDDTTLITLSSLSIGVNVPFILVINYRKTGGAASDFRIGLTVNTTQAITSASNPITSTTDRIESGVVTLLVGARTTNNLRPVSWILGNSVGSGGATFDVVTGTDFPNATITTLVITGRVGNASITGGVSSVKLYTLTGS